MKIEEIEVGTRLRARRDVSELAKSIAEVGLLNPITVTESGRLIAGLHRLEACKLLGWREIPVTISELNDLDAQLAEIDENLMRGDLSEAERADHYMRRKALYEEKYPETKHGGDRRSNDDDDQNENFSFCSYDEPVEESSDDDAHPSFAKDTADKTGVTERTVQACVRRAKKIAPDVMEQLLHNDILADIADTNVELDALVKLDHDAQREVIRLVLEKRAAGEKAKKANVRNTIREMNREERTEQILTESKAGDGPKTTTRYPVLLADPPWRYEHAVSTSREIENQYPTMELGDICALKVADLVTADAVLYLWVTSPKLEEGLEVMHSWGFTYRSCLVWVKDKIGMGYWARQRHELLLVGTRGNMPAPPPEVRPDSVIEAPRGEHSAKPVEAYELIERCWPTLPKLELFCRTPREGWDRWGHEA